MNGCDVLFVLSALGLGGSERKMSRVASELAASGVRTALCALGPPYTLVPHLHGRIITRTLDRRRRLSPQVLRQLQAMLAEHRPRTVVAVDLFALFYLSMARRAAGLRDTKLVVLINTTSFVRWRDRAFMFGYAPLLRRVDLIVFGSSRQRGEWVKNYRLDRVPTCVIHNGVDVTPYPGSREAARDGGRRLAGLPPDRVVIGTVGRLAPEKNQLGLVRALARLDAAAIDAHLLLVGEGRMRDAILAEANRLGVSSRVTLAGEVQYVQPLLAVMDVFVLPSTAVETFSNAALEAMSMALPVVLSDIGGAREMIDHGCEGLIVQPGDQQALDEALLRLCADTGRRCEMGAAARRRAEVQFDFGGMVDSYREIIGPTPCRTPGATR